MRTTLIILAICCTGIAIAQSPVIQVANNSNSISVNFTLPAYTLQDTSVADLYNVPEIFKYIAINQFGTINDVGYPMLPQLTFDLHVPKGAFGFSVSVTNPVTEVVKGEGK